MITTERIRQIVQQAAIEEMYIDKEGSEENIEKSSHLEDDLGIDSIGFIDVARGIEERLEKELSRYVELPLQEWLDNHSKNRTEENPLIFGDLCILIERFISEE